MENKARKYYEIPAYTMKCRLYLNEEQKKVISNAIYGLKVAYNVTLHEAFANYECTKEKNIKPKEGDKEQEERLVHFPDFGKMASKEHLNKLREEYPIIKGCTKAACLSINQGIFRTDMQKAFNSAYEKKTGKKSTGKNMPMEFVKRGGDVHFYSKSHPRMSMTFQIGTSAFTTKENRNVLYVNLGKFGENQCGVAKIRGWNKNIRFDQDGTMDFLDFILSKPNRQITVTVSKDKCGDYYICLKFGRTYSKITNRMQGIAVYKPFTEADGEVGIDVGKATLITCSDSKIEDEYYKDGKVENPRFKARSRDEVKSYGRRLSLKQGYSNKKWLETYKKDRENIKPSKKYNKAKLKFARLHRKITRERENHYNVVTKRLVENYNFIGIESLKVSDMFKDQRTAEEKDMNNPKFKSKKTERRKNDNTSDAAMSTLLEMIKYKAEWYDRTLIAVGEYYPSSQICSNCGHRDGKKELSIREWTCPVCGMRHDRDVNAAKNILAEALRIHSEDLEDSVAQNMA